MSCVLYSANPRIKLVIQERFRNNLHYVWCAEQFDSSKASAYSAAALTAPSSDPKKIYDGLYEDCARSDRHSAKIKDMKSSLIALAGEWSSAGECSAEQAQEIVFLANQESFDLWRPLLYVIPRKTVEAKLRLVPVDRRASAGLEYIIPDLARHEFDIMELR